MWTGFPIKKKPKQLLKISESARGKTFANDETQNQQIQMRTSCGTLLYTESYILFVISTVLCKNQNNFGLVMWRQCANKTGTKVCKKIYKMSHLTLVTNPLGRN